MDTPLLRTHGRGVSATDRYLSETREIIERSKAHIAALCASVARTEEAIRRGKAALDPAGIGPIVVAEPGLRSDAGLHLARDIARHCAGVDIQPSATDRHDAFVER